MDSEERDDYSAAILSPLYRSPPTAVDMLWVGATSSNESMAAEQSAWRSSEVFNDWPASDCSISMLATQYAVGSPIPENVMTDEMVVAYWYCNLNEGSTIPDVTPRTLRPCRRVLRQGPCRSHGSSCPDRRASPICAI